MKGTCLAAGAFLAALKQFKGEPACGSPSLSMAILFLGDPVLHESHEDCAVTDNLCTAGSYLCNITGSYIRILL